MTTIIFIVCCVLYLIKEYLDYRIIKRLINKIHDLEVENIGIKYDIECHADRIYNIEND